MLSICYIECCGSGVNAEVAVCADRDRGRGKFRGLHCKERRETIFARGKGPVVRSARVCGGWCWPVTWYDRNRQGIRL